MKPEEWRQIDRIFSEALDCEPSERARFIEEACAGDRALQDSVESLIASHEKAGKFLETGGAETSSSLRESIAHATVPAGLRTIVERSGI